MNLLTSLEELIFPVRCLGCGALGLEICSQCRRFWQPRIYRSHSRRKPHFPIYSSIPYSPIAGKVLLAAKEHGIQRADELMVSALSHSLSICLQEQGIGFLVPIPSRKSVARLRGRQFINGLAREIGSGAQVPTYEILTHTRAVKDQSKLDAKERLENLDGALTSLRYRSGKAIIVDDLVTTGVTLQEAARALRAAGIEVSAAITACVAEPLR
jgi:predicted amidophosphoribosyltransferase